jgi:hypothetical protein
MARIGFLSASCILGAPSELREDGWEHDLEFEALRAGCEERDLHLKAVVWDDPNLNPVDFDAFVIGTTWDYAQQPSAFLAVLTELSAQRPLFNPLSVVRWNLDKSYLRELGAAGVPVVPTLWRERCDAATVEAAFEDLDSDELVLKPAVGASAWRQVRLRRGDPLPPRAELPPGVTLIQPFLPSVVREGELSFVCFDGRFSHALRKMPARGDYRSQSIYGARESVHVPRPDELRLTEAILNRVPRRLLYGRVDLLRGADGGLLLVELELIEPYLYPVQGPQMGRRFARALERMLQEA